MKNKIVTLILCFMLFLTLSPCETVYAYADLTDFNNYIENLEITYKDLDLTPEELDVIEELQKNGGITYGMHSNDNTVFMIFQQISKVFNFDATPVIYEDYATLLKDVANGTIDFTGSMLPTQKRLELYDFTTSTHKDITFLYIKHSDFDIITKSNIKINKVLKVGYPSGFALDGLLSEDFKESYKYELIKLNSVDEAVKLVEAGELDMVFGDISWYEELVALENYMAIDYTKYIDTYFSGNLTKKGTNKELISAINKMYSETDALVQLQNQLDNYYESAALYALREKYYDDVNHEKINKIYVSEYRPYVYLEDGVAKGLLVELLDRIFDDFDLKYEITFAHNLNTDYISEKEITVAMPVFDTAETQERYTLSIPIAKSRMAVITKPDETSKYFTSVEDLEIQKVGVLDYEYMHDYVGDVFINDDDIFYYDDLETLVSAIDADEVKFGIVPYEEFNKYAIENQIVKIGVLSALTMPSYSIAFGTPITERGVKYEAILSSALSILNYSDLENKYLSTTPEMETIYKYKAEMYYSRLHMIVFSAIFAVTVLFALIYINQKRANTDYLTKIRNRRSLEAYIKATKAKKNMSIAYIDLDNFKIINDVYGHHYGDKVLIYVANGLSALSKHSRAFRIGGDEFIIVYNNKHICFNEDIKAILNKTIIIEQTNIKVEGSVGNLNLEKYSDLDVNDIINLVDYAMISAKRRGKNIVVEIDDVLVENYLTIRDLRAVLENEQYDDTVKLYLESIKKESDLYGFCLIAKCHHNNHSINYEELRIHMTNKLVLNKIGLLMFEKLCESINKMRETSQIKMRYIYEIEASSVNKQNVEALSALLTKHNIDAKDINLRVDPTLFTGKKGIQYVELINQLGCNISIDFYKLTGESLLYINYLDCSMIEIDLSELIYFLKNKDFSNTTLVYEELSSNLAINKIIDLCNLFSVSLLLYTYNDELVNMIMDFFLEKLDTPIYYIEKDNLILLDDYLQNYK